MDQRFLEPRRNAPLLWLRSTTIGLREFAKDSRNPPKSLVQHDSRKGAAKFLSEAGGAVTKSTR
jgi:hypothetical protein